ncbi:MAG: repressor LexA [Candidatus Brocadia carolinensis]|uniref:LexA repressor n=1 Tax=Candidatus Brocadia carolinensis TaxID=1004156 RepID=A0A1V4AXI7_9BACT|nr:MAG: repressor LexA [Candidatus Brocadia caroliniensis]
MNPNKSKPANVALSKKQADFFLFLKDYLQEKGFPPTIRELRDGLGLSSTNMVKKYLDVLERKRYIRRQFNSPRAIEIIGVAATSEVRHIPIVGKIRAGIPHPPIEDIEGSFPVDKAICRNHKAFFLRVVGDSMINAHILDGDLVLVVPQPVAHNGEIVAVLIDDEATVKRFYQKGNTIELKPDHPTMKPITITEGQADVHIIGKITAVIRQLDR